MKRLVINKFYGGISNDPSIGGVGSVNNAEGVDLRNNSKYVQLNSSQTSVAAFMSTSESYKVIASIFASATNFLEFSRPGRITSQAKNSFDSNYVVDLGGLLYNAGVVNTGTGIDYGFIIGATNKLYKWTYDAGDAYLGAGAGGGNITNQTHTTNFTEDAPYIIIQNFIYIGAGDKVVEVDTTTATFVLTDVLSIDAGFTIKGMTKISDQVFIYATDGATTKQYLWDGVNTTTSRTITWIDKPLQNVANFGNIDYLVIGGSASNETALYKVIGLQLELLYKNAVISDTEQQRIFFSSEYTNAIETIGTRLLIPNNGDVYTYGQETPGLPTSLVKEFLSPLNYVTSLNYSVLNSANLNVYGYGNFGGTDGIYKITHVLSGTYSTQTEGFIEMQPLFGDTYSNIKNYEKTTLGYKLEVSTAINLYYKPDDGTNYAIIYNVFGAEIDIPSIGDTYTSSVNTYTVYGVSNIGTTAVIFATYTGVATLYKGTFTKTAGSGVSSFHSDKVRLEYKYIESFTDNTRGTANTPFEFNDSQFAIGLMTGDEDVTPKLYDINLYYNEDSDD